MGTKANNSLYVGSNHKILRLFRRIFVTKQNHSFTIPNQQELARKWLAQL
jgi:carbamoylphosphate synthase small subunit